MAQFTLDSSVLVVIVLIACLACIYMVFFFGRRLQTSAYLRDSLVEGAQQQELKVLLRELQDRALEGPLDSSYPPPMGYGSTARLWKKNEYGAKAAGPPSSYANETEDQKINRLDRERKEQERRIAIKTWEDEELARYDVLRKEAARVALERARRRVPSSIDISLLGGGWAFLLEFSTVIVIIFALLILGILKILEGREIATILAAIAGYVLGKATGSAKQPEKAISSSPTISMSGE